MRLAVVRAAQRDESISLPCSRELTSLVEGAAKRRRMRLQQHVGNGELAPQIGPLGVLLFFSKPGPGSVGAETRSLTHQ
jgi:hypothetical protein